LHAVQLSNAGAGKYFRPILIWNIDVNRLTKLVL